MEELLKVALVGTARQPAPPLSDQPPDRVLAPHSGAEAEQALLLRAGAWSIYQTAGYTPSSAEPLPPAHAEDLPPCSARAALLLRDVLARNDETLLVDACGRLAAGGLRLPFDLLPDFLDQRKHEVRAALRPVLGQRGRWLGRFRESWLWAAETVVPETEADEALPPESERLWQEGTLGERAAVLRQVRRRDADRARQWLEEVWSQEKADHRIDLLEALTAGLSQADESFLEDALADRSKRVRTLAAELLAKIGGSALAERMRARADVMLDYEPPAPRGRLAAAVSAAIGGTDDVGKLAITPPAQCEKEWQRDGIEPKPPQGVGERAYWMSQVVALVRPSHWVNRFSAPPGRLIAAATADDFAFTLIDAWSVAALRFDDASWVEALWDFWYEWQPKRKRGTQSQFPQRTFTELLAKMTPESAEIRIAKLFDRMPASESVAMGGIVASLPRPWSEALGRAYLRRVRGMVAAASRADRQSAADWIATLTTAARAIPHSCFAAALEPWNLPASDDYFTHYSHRAVEEFQSTVRLRKEFAQAVRNRDSADLAPG